MRRGGTPWATRAAGENADLHRPQVEHDGRLLKLDRHLLGPLLGPAGEATASVNHQRTLPPCGSAALVRALLRKGLLPPPT